MQERRYSGFTVHTLSGPRHNALQVFLATSVQGAGLGLSLSSDIIGHMAGNKDSTKMAKEPNLFSCLIRQHIPGI